MTTPAHLSNRMGGEPSPDELAARAARAGADDGRGMLDFAAFMIFAAGVFNAVYGLTALLNDDYFRADELLFGDLSLWGTLFLVVAVVQGLVALLVLRRSSVGAVLGIVLAGCSILLTLAAVEARPLWSMIILTVDVIIIYALTVYGFGHGAWGERDAA
jgi:hypothetical protein